MMARRKRSKKESSDEELSFSEHECESDNEECDADDDNDVSNDDEDDGYEDMNEESESIDNKNDDIANDDTNTDINDDTHRKNRVLFPQLSLLSQIKNKIRRREMYVKVKQEKKEAKKESRKQRLNLEKVLGDKAPPKQVPHTIESMREPDETFVDPDDEEVKIDESLDEMSSFFRREREPKVLITSSDNPHTKTIKFCRELKQTLPGAEFRWRNRSSVKKMVKAAINRDYSDILIVNEDWRKPNGLLHIHLPNGPTAYYKLSSVRFCKDIKNRAKYSVHRPEVILNNFNTRLGHTIGRMFASIVHYDPQFHGRRVITFHNQRDYIFVRHHRYEFKNNAKVAIQEIGPRFTLKLRSLQRGTFDSKFGEFEWTLRRHEMGTNRRKFFI